MSVVQSTCTITSDESGHKRNLSFKMAVARQNARMPTRSETNAHMRAMQSRNVATNRTHVRLPAPTTHV